LLAFARWLSGELAASQLATESLRQRLALSELHFYIAASLAGTTLNVLGGFACRLFNGLVGVVVFATGAGTLFWVMVIADRIDAHRQTLALYLATRADAGRKVSTIALTRTAISQVHIRAGTHRRAHIRSCKSFGKVGGGGWG